MAKEEAPFPQGHLSWNSVKQGRLRTVARLPEGRQRVLDNRNRQWQTSLEHSRRGYGD